MAKEETWEERYKRAVANFAGCPQDVALEDITVQVYDEDGYYYSEYTNADPRLSIMVQWPGGYRDLDTPSEIAQLIQSFLSPGGEA
jgi:hypothetical protein